MIFTNPVATRDFKIYITQYSSGDTSMTLQFTYALLGAHNNAALLVHLPCFMTGVKGVKTMSSIPTALRRVFHFAKSYLSEVTKKKYRDSDFDPDTMVYDSPQCTFCEGKDLKKIMDNMAIEYNQETLALVQSLYEDYAFAVIKVRGSGVTTTVPIKITYRPVAVTGDASSHFVPTYNNAHEVGVFSRAPLRKASTKPLFELLLSCSGLSGIPTVPVYVFDDEFEQLEEFEELKPLLPLYYLKLHSMSNADLLFNKKDLGVRFLYDHQGKSIKELLNLPTQ